MRVRSLLLTALVGLAVAAPAEARLRQPNPIGAHAIVWDQPHRDNLFREAARLGVSHIGVAHFVDGPLTPLAENVRLARRHGLRINLLVTSESQDWEAFPEQVRPVARAAGWAIDEWTVINEPDTPFFGGTAEEYERVLNATYAVIHEEDPVASVLNGAPVHRDSEWITGRFDQANVHTRPSRLGAVSWNVDAWTEFYSGEPIQVTEFGYSADRRFQTDPAFQGWRGQAEFYSRALPTMIAGTERTYVTLRDLGHPARERFHHEGLLARSDLDNGQGADMRRRPSYRAVSRVIERYAPRVGRTFLRTERRPWVVRGQLKGDQGCRADRKLVLRRKLRRSASRNWDTIQRTRTDESGGYRFVVRRRAALRVVVHSDGVCERESRTRR